MLSGWPFRAPTVTLTPLKFTGPGVWKPFATSVLATCYLWGCEAKLLLLLLLWSGAYFYLSEWHPVGGSYWVSIYMLCVLQGSNLEPSLMRCCHSPCESRPIDHSVNICNKLLLDIRRHIKKYYSVSIRVYFAFFLFPFISHGPRNHVILDLQTNNWVVHTPPHKGGFKLASTKTRLVWAFHVQCSAQHAFIWRG